MSNHEASTSSAEIFGSNRMWGLKEIPLPDPVSWVPQTVGWYIFAIIFLAVLAWYLQRLWLRYQRNAYRRKGLEMLSAMLADPASASSLPFLLRKSALAAAKRENVAGLRGREWIAWLNDCAGTPLFDEADGAALDRLAYCGDGYPPLDKDHIRHLIEASQIWMRSHRAAI